MASNFVNRGNAIEIKFPKGSTDIKPATFNVGDPCIIGHLPAIAMSDRDGNSTKATFWFYGKYKNIKVAATRNTNSVNANLGSKLYFLDSEVPDDTDNSIKSYLSTDSASGKKWGYSLGFIAAPTGSDGHNIREIDVIVGY